jgi:NAD(P)-dependent dehydrogenase (short-subunit alcohol dehydrogenase family)
MLIASACVALAALSHRRLTASAGSGKGTLLWVLFIASVLALASLRQATLGHLVLRPVDLTGRVAVVTGGTAGLGLETARVLASWNATVVLPARNVTKGEAVKRQLEALLPRESTGSFRLMECDLASLKSVRSFAAAFLATSDTCTSEDGQNACGAEAPPSIDMLILNAGIAGTDETPLEKTEDGYEVVFQANYLGHYLLARLLLPAVRRAAATRGEARVVHVSSIMHYLGDLDHARLENGNSDPATAHLGLASYADSELLQVVFSNKLDRLEGAAASGVRSISIHPGFVWSDIDRTGGAMGEVAKALRERVGRSTEQGAVTQITAATLPHPGWAGERWGTRGVYLHDCCINVDCTGEYRFAAPFCHAPAPGGGTLPHPVADDFDEQDWLWATSARLVGLPE